MEEDPSGAAYLIKLVHVVGQQIDDLASRGLPHGRVTKAKGLTQKRDRRVIFPQGGHT